MSRHRRQQHRRQRRGLARTLARFSRMAELVVERWRDTGRFPRWATSELVDAVVRGGLL